MEEVIQQRSFNSDTPRIVNASGQHMACLFLLDTSESMAGTGGMDVRPIDELVSALNRFKIEVCEDSTTRDMLDVAIVEFNTKVRVVQEFVSIEYMETVSLEAYGGTNMTAGLRTAIDMVLERRQFYCQSGVQHYCSWIVMITDGYPSDSIDNIAEEILTLDQQDKLRLLSLAVEGADVMILNKLGHGKRVFTLKNYDFTAFFSWINKSMRGIGQFLPENVDKVVDGRM